MTRSTARWLLAVIVAAAAMLVVLGLANRHEAPAADRPTPGSATASATARASVPVASSMVTETPGPTTAIGPAHVWLVLLENRSYDQVIGSTNAPYLNDLAAHYGVATDYRAVARPSEPNYLALISGSTQGVSDDGTHNLRAPTLLDQLEAAGRDWRVYAENLPAGCFTGATASGGADGAGTYARKHEPAISFTSVNSDPARCARITDLAHFSTAAADFSLIVPNLCHDMHDCSTREGDRWLAAFLPRITGSAAFRDGGLLIITFDEAAGGDGSQRVRLVFAGPGVAAGTRANGRASHYSLLRTLEDAWGLPCLAQACHASAIPELRTP